ncbi:MAG: RNA polymerase sigma factor SigZ [Proteobacteria bacterium]|nr:RNA polymerase sigma factor SigZ [Pseudomonadota bacterium]MBU1594478.1 RNA polymerase sigma factor SigZ [Pseudomonadota bacterium]
MRRRLEAIWQEHRGELKSFILKRVHGAVEAEDILHEVFLKMLAGLGSVQRVDSLRAWLFTVARNAVTDHFRSKRPMQELPEDLADHGKEGASSQEEDVGACLRPIIEALPEKVRLALILADMEGLKQREVAHRLGISLAAAKSRILRGRLLVRRMIEDCCTLELDARGSIMDYTVKPKGCPHCGPGPGPQRVPK